MYSKDIGVWEMGTFGKRLKQLREEKNLTQKALAEHLAINRDALAKWETDRSLPDLETISTIVEFFDIPTDYLLGKDIDSFETKVLEVLRNNQHLMSEEEKKFLLAMIVNYIDTIKRKK